MLQLLQWKGNSLTLLKKDEWNEGYTDLSLTNSRKERVTVLWEKIEWNAPYSNRAGTRKHYLITCSHISYSSLSKASNETEPGWIWRKQGPRITVSSRGLIKKKTKIRQSQRGFILTVIDTDLQVRCTHLRQINHTLFRVAFFRESLSPLDHLLFTFTAFFLVHLGIRTCLALFLSNRWLLVSSCSRGGIRFIHNT